MVCEISWRACGLCLREEKRSLALDEEEDRVRGMEGMIRGGQTDTEGFEADGSGRSIDSSRDASIF